MDRCAVVDNDILIILESVKSVSCIPHTKYLTTSMVADWFEVGYEGIATCLKRNRKALEKEGVVLKSYQEIVDMSLGLVSKDNGISPRGSYVFPVESLFYISTMINSNISDKIKDVVASSGSFQLSSRLLFSNDRILKKQRDVHKNLLEAFSGVYVIESEVNHDRYRADFIISNEYKEIVVEIDEFGHKDYNKQEELEREKSLLKRYNALIRYNPDDENENVFQLINKIIKEMSKC